MNGHGEEMYRFVCPKCAESLEVNASMRTVLLESGCVICDARVPASAFTLTERAESHR